MEKEKSVRRYTVAELFCGCGGFSHGFSRTNRFNVVFGNDVKEAALQTFRFNHVSESGEPETLKQDIRTVSIDSITAALERRGIKTGELDCLIGGPPCQGFSQMRRSEERKDDALVRFKGYNKLDQDPRNDLVLRFLEIANHLNPKYIVIENVPQMRSHTHNGERGGLMESVKSILCDMGYAAKAEIVNAANYGVPQLRERLIVIASRISSASLPEPTHVDTNSVDLLSVGRDSWVTVYDAIKDLPSPPLGSKDIFGGGSISLYQSVELSEFADKLRSRVAFPYNHVTRQYSSDIINTIKEMSPGETWDAASQRMRDFYEPKITDLEKQGLSRDNAIQRLVDEGVINEKFFNRYYWSAYTRLDWKRPALTITANANFLGSGRFTHPVEHRGITMREAARLQSFDDDFRFITSADDISDTTTIGIGLDMIGEAVPPLLAEAIANHIILFLDKYYDEQNSTDVISNIAQITHRSDLSPYQTNNAEKV